jgi:putative ABC transport system permease protein
MLFNYLKVGLRNLLKYKVFSFINVFGLAAAMSVCMLIILMLADQKSHDQFNVNKDRIYRILSDGPDFRHPYATSPSPLAAVLQKDYPVVQTSTRLEMGVGGDVVYSQNGGEAGGGSAAGREGSMENAEKSAEVKGYFADSSFFNVFSFELERGDKAFALAAPNSIVLTHELAHQLFNNEDPIGRSVRFVDRGLNLFGQAGAPTATPWGNFTVTGVIADRPYKSHLRFNALLSTSSMPALVKQGKLTDRSQDWSNYYNCMTYALLAPGKNSQDLDAALHELVARKYVGIKDFKGFRMMGQSLLKISPGILLGNESSIVLPVTAYYFLAFLAMVILGSACLNYINLSVARALNRSKEIGVRKVTGALRGDLIVQFLSESILTALFAMGMAILLLFVLKAAFMRLWVNQYLNFDLRENGMIFVIFICLACLIGIIAGIYPALYLSKFRPILALKSKEGMGSRKGMGAGWLGTGRLRLRKVLSVTQFAISLLFIITSILIYNQFRYFMAFKYEFNTKNIVDVNLQSNDYKMARTQFAGVPGVVDISACNYMPASTHSEGGQLRRADGKRPDGKQGAGEDSYVDFMSLSADDHFLGNLGLKIVAGRNLPPLSAGASRYIVVNETAVKALGYPDRGSIVGQAVQSHWSDSPLVVIGVVQNFHMRMILGNDSIQPLFLQHVPSSFQYLNIKIASRDVRGTMAKLESRWRLIDPVHAFKYEFYDEDLAASSQGIFDVVAILGFFAVLAVTIACLGMLGMATYTTERRRKEVGIRKVLGAKNFGNAMLLSREFLNILVISILIAAPLSYILNTMWLRKFPNRVEFGWGTVLTGTCVVLVLGLITIGSQTIRASRRNPVESLKAE